MPATARKLPEDTDLSNLPEKEKPWLFKKGQSGNPSGKSKQFASIQELARSHAPAMVGILAKVARSKTAPVAARVTAAGMLLDRAYGKPAGFSTSSPEAFRKAVDLSDDELAAIVSAGRGKVLELVAKAIPDTPTIPSSSGDVEKPA